MLITEEVYICPVGTEMKRYESLGYIIPKYYNEKQNKWKYKKGTKICVNINDLPKNSNMKVKCKCDNCGKITENAYVDYIKHNYNGKTYCNNCSSTVFISGENNYKWNNKKTREQRIIDRGNVGYHYFKLSVLKRDNYTCIICGKKHKDLVVHHLDSYDWCEEKRQDISNGVTLCEICHKNFHSIYGNGNNTKEQFIEWSNKTLDYLNKNIEIISTRKCICIETKEIIPSIKIYGEQNNVDVSGIYKSCNNTIKTSYHGKHYMWYDEYEKLSFEDILKLENKIDYQMKNYNKTTCKKVVNITKNELYNSLKEAGLSVGCKHYSYLIEKIRRKEVWKGYLWCYLEDYNGNVSDLKKVEINGRNS